ncbi:hypothetical protein [Marinifilum caeruleilacunae]|uniref:DUF4595 domain-containing protein n=1 Tax=Marinifilum caeruleilacunae TaxID=2499076 RepID=A0ABX1WU90_9BACT|nr:hypothetical protein [Marinifilum caeruleilacunae]NOU59669.1 hypothetical protein [Marinifilum caeruleilacunae]
MNVCKGILLGLVLLACSQEGSIANDHKPNGDENSQKLLRTMQSDQRVTSYQYNRDSTLHSIRVEWNGELRSESVMVYDNGKLSEIIWRDGYNQSPTKRVFEYKGDLLVKESMLADGEILNMCEYFYDENNQMVREIQKREWNNEATKKKIVIDVHRPAGKNEIQLSFNGIPSFKFTYDENMHPLAKIKGYSIIRKTSFYGIANNILTYTKIAKKGKDLTEKSELTYDSSGNILLELTKTGENERLICKEIYNYR